MQKLILGKYHGFANLFSTGGQSLSLRGAVGVEERLLADTNRSVAISLAETFVIKCSGMECRSIIPDG